MPTLQELLQGGMGTTSPAGYPVPPAARQVPTPDQKPPMPAPLPAPAAQGGAPMPLPLQPNQYLPVEGPPADPADQNQRVEGWKQWLGKLANDPNVQRMAFMMGAQLMQPVAPGQSVGGHFAQAAVSGVDYANTVASGQRQAQLAEREQTRKESGTEQDIKASEASIETNKERTDILKDELEFKKDEASKTYQINMAKLKQGDKRLDLVSDELGLKSEELAWRMKDRLKDLSLQEARIRVERIRSQYQAALLNAASKTAKKNLTIKGDLFEGGQIVYQNGVPMIRLWADLDNDTLHTEVLAKKDGAGGTGGEGGATTPAPSGVQQPPTSAPAPSGKPGEDLTDEQAWGLRERINTAFKNGQISKEVFDQYMNKWQEEYGARFTRFPQGNR